jgi:hypothetical protein
MRRSLICFRATKLLANSDDLVSAAIPPQEGETPCPSSRTIATRRGGLRDSAQRQMFIVLPAGAAHSFNLLFHPGW